MWLLGALFLGGFSLYLLVYLVVPKGTVLHEMLDLPWYWLRHQFHGRTDLKGEKVPYGVHKRQYFLFFKPKASVPDKKTVVIYIHGGSWRFGKPDYFKPNAGFFVDKGYMVVLPAHRNPPKFKYPEIRHDMQDMLLQLDLHLKVQKKKGSIRLILAGMSSGGHLASMILYDKEILAHLRWSAKDVLGLMVSGAPLHFNLLRDSFILRDFAGPRSGQLFQIASPTYHIDPQAKTPVLCFHGDKDGIVPLASINPFLKMLRQYRIPLDLHIVKNGNHMSGTRWLYVKGKERALLESWLERIEQQSDVLVIS